MRKDIAQRIGRIEDAIAIGAGLSGATEKTQTDAASTSSDQNPALGGAAGNRRDLKPDAQGSKCHVSPLLGSVSSGGLGKVYFGGCYLGAIDSNTMPSLSAEGRRWIFSATREWPTLPSFNDPDNPGQRQSFASSTSTPRHGGHLEQHAELPTRWVVESLLGQFLESDLSHIFPVVDPILFRDTLTQVYGPDSEAHVSDVASAKSCILAFVSFAGRHFTGTKEASYIDTDACALDSQSLASGVLEDATLTTLQATILVVSPAIRQGKFARPLTYCPMA